MTALSPRWRSAGGDRIVNAAPRSGDRLAEPPGAADVEAAARRIGAYVDRTPVVEVPIPGLRAVAKLECRQRTGSFKARGAANRMLTLEEAERRAGVTTASSGNHGRAVAETAAALGIRAVVCLPRSVDPLKRAAIEAAGADVRATAASYDDAVVEAQALCASDGLTFVHAFDDPLVIAGQGTVGLELVAAAPGLDAVLVPLSGGGLAAGVALAVKARSPATRVVGVSARHAAVLHHALLAGRPVEVREHATLASALSGGLGADNRHSLRLVHALLDEAVVVDEAQIAGAMRWARARLDLVVEGGGAVALAPLLDGGAEAAERWGPHIAAIVSGGNVDPEALEGVT